MTSTIPSPTSTPYLTLPSPRARSRSRDSRSVDATTPHAPARDDGDTVLLSARSSLSSPPSLPVCSAPAMDNVWSWATPSSSLSPPAPGLVISGGDDTASSCGPSSDPDAFEVPEAESAAIDATASVFSSHALCPFTESGAAPFPYAHRVQQHDGDSLEASGLKRESKARDDPTCYDARASSINPPCVEPSVPNIRPCHSTPLKGGQLAALREGTPRIETEDHRPSTLLLFPHPMESPPPPTTCVQLQPETYSPLPDQAATSAQTAATAQIVSGPASTAPAICGSDPSQAALNEMLAARRSGQGVDLHLVPPVSLPASSSTSPVNGSTAQAETGMLESPSPLSSVIPTIMPRTQRSVRRPTLPPLKTASEQIHANGTGQAKGDGFIPSQRPSRIIPESSRNCASPEQVLMDSKSVGDDPWRSQSCQDPQSSGCGATRFSSVISCIIPDFLFLGPDITTREEVATLQAMGIQRVLNMAFEAPDRDGDGIDLVSEFEQYQHIPLLDSVEAEGIQGIIEGVCAFLDTAHSDSAPVYVHCRAGKSRSVMAVTAYLMYTRRWSWRKAHEHVISKRSEADPNLGFVYELINFERRLGLPPSSFPHHSTSGAISAPPEPNA